MVISTGTVHDNRRSDGKPLPSAMALSFSETYARAQAVSLRKSGLRHVRVCMRSVKAHGGVADVWVVTWLDWTREG